MWNWMKREKDKYKDLTFANWKVGDLVMRWQSMAKPSSDNAPQDAKYMAILGKIVGKIRMLL